MSAIWSASRAGINDRDGAFIVARPRLCGLRSMCASVRGDPVFMRRINGWLTVFWIVMIPISIVTGWIHSVAYISALSLWALVSGHWSAWQAARVEVAQQREQEARRENPPEERVVEALISETTIEKIEAIETHGQVPADRRSASPRSARVGPSYVE